MAMSDQFIGKLSLAEFEKVHSALQRRTVDFLSSGLVGWRLQRDKERGDLLKAGLTQRQIEQLEELGQRSHVHRLLHPMPDYHAAIERMKKAAAPEWPIALSSDAVAALEACEKARHAKQRRGLTQKRWETDAAFRKRLWKSRKRGF